MSIKNIKVISRNPDHYMRETKHDIFKVQRNFNPDLHPLQTVREYKLALNAVKLDKVFAKPFIGSLAHSDSVSALCRHPYQLSCIYSSTVEGELNLWNIQTKKLQWKVQAHNGEISCITSSPDGQSFFTVGVDKTIKRWSVAKIFEENADLPMDTWLCDNIITGISHHYGCNEFVTCGERIFLWDLGAKSPKCSFDWGTSSNKNEATSISIKFNPVEKNVFATCDHANNIILYDTRLKDIKKLKMKLRINALAWNPMEAMILTAASEDYNCYSFDIRRFDEKRRIVSIHKDHTAAVIDLDYSPTGKEFCTASYDKTIRIFRADESYSRDVYHSKRMFRIKCVQYSGDGRFISSGSSDHNVRIWKNYANEKLGIMKSREKTAIQFGQELTRKYATFPEIRRIARHRHLPRAVYVAKKEHAKIRTKLTRKESNRRRHSKPGSVPFTSAVEVPVIGLQDDFNDDQENDDQ